jgi:nucleoside-diphosphate-sugar epimerase/predicted dehydrogenase
VTPFADAREMLAAVKPDVVHVVTPPATHAFLAKACLESGANAYVEKPFALTVGEAESVLEIADSRRLRVCAAHQVLFQDAGRAYRRHLPMIGDIVHVESFFSFRPVRRHAGGGGLSTPVSQLIDILPHPVYLLLDALPHDGGARAEVTALDVSIEGEVRAVIRRGRAFGLLVVSLNARPVESWLRVMGANGMVEADFVLGNVIRHPGPGASAPAVVLKPFSRAWQIGWGSFKAVLKLVFRRHRSYPGLAELLDLFYASIREGTTLPMSAAEITDTVRICETVSERLHEVERIADQQAVVELRRNEASLPPFNDRGVVLLTGGTGMLGRSTAQLLRAAGWRVRVPVRRMLSPRDKLPGIEYVMTDLAEAVPESLLAGVETVLHLAAETAGNKADHERNTIQATRNLIDAMARSGTRRLVNVSSVAVLKPSRFGRPLKEDSPVDYGNLKRGPYVWAKAESERMAMEAARTGAIEVRTVRLGPLVDFDEFAAPGRLGREVARLFVAMGWPSSRLGVCSVADAAAVLCCYARAFDHSPSIVNLLQVPAPTRRELANRLRQARPDLHLIWLPFPILRILGMAFSLAQKLLRPSSSPLDLYAAFAAESYGSEVAGRVFAAADLRGNGDPAENETASTPDSRPGRR